MDVQEGRANSSIFSKQCLLFDESITDPWTLQLNTWLFSSFLLHLQTQIRAQRKCSETRPYLIWKPLKHRWGEKATMKDGFKNKSVLKLLVKSCSVEILLWHVAGRSTQCTTPPSKLQGVAGVSKLPYNSNNSARALLDPVYRLSPQNIHF